MIEKKREEVEEEKEGEGKRIRTDAREMEEREESFEIKEN